MFQRAYFWPSSEEASIKILKGEILRDLSSDFTFYWDRIPVGTIGFLGFSIWRASICLGFTIS